VKALGHVSLYKHRPGTFTRNFSDFVGCVAILSRFAFFSRQLSDLRPGRRASPGHFSSSWSSVSPGCQPRSTYLHPCATCSTVYFATLGHIITDHISSVPQPSPIARLATSFLRRVSSINNLSIDNLSLSHLNRANSQGTPLGRFVK
jgi:hypothetical protein